jgi:ethanolamine utilization protein EutQ (cupin superfamily)
MKKFHCFLFIAVPMLAASYSAGAGDLKIKHVKNAQKMEIKSLGEEGVNAFLTDIVASDNPDAPIACGLFRMEKGKPLKYTYTYDEAKIMLDGEMAVSDGSSTVHVKPGDVLYFPKGIDVTFTSDSSGLAFYCGARKSIGA